MINWNYLAYICLAESAKWDNYAGAIPGSELYSRFCNCAVKTSNMLIAVEHNPLKSSIPESNRIEELAAKLDIGLTAANLRAVVTKKEADELLQAYGLKRKPEGTKSAFVSQDFNLTMDELAQVKHWNTQFQTNYI